MSSATTTQLVAPRTVPPAGQQLRLRLKPKAPTTGHVDGAWWPRTRDLPAELTDLLAELAVRLGRIDRVSYHLGDWNPAPRKIAVEGSVVRLAGYRAQHPDTLDMLAAGRRLTLLVVPPGTPPLVAHRALMTAAHRGNADRITDLLGSPTLPPQVVPRPDDALAAASEERWESDGGRVYRDR